MAQMTDRVETFDEWCEAQRQRAHGKRRWSNRNARHGKKDSERIVLTDEPILDETLAAQLAAWQRDAQEDE